MVLDKQKIILLGCGVDAGYTAQLQQLLSKDYSVVGRRPDHVEHSTMVIGGANVLLGEEPKHTSLSEVTELFGRDASFIDELGVGFTPDREYGWYRKFDKPNKRK